MSRFFKHLGEVKDVFKSHGWSVEGLNILELYKHAQESTFADQTLFDTRDIELSTVTIIAALEEMRPARLVIDSLSELAMVLNNPAQFRFQILKLKRRLIQSNCTALLTSGETIGENLSPVNTLVHGIIQPFQDTGTFMEPRRRLEVTKIRGRRFYGGYHDFRIQTGGLQVFPRLERLEVESETQGDAIQFSSGKQELDMMLGGGLEEGTVCMILGTPGVGKSLFGALYLESAARQKLHAAAFCFDESKESYLRRGTRLELALASNIQDGLVELFPIQMGEMSFGEFMQLVKEQVEIKRARVVVIDSLVGMTDALSGPLDLPLRRFHELISYLNRREVLTILIVATHGLFGELKTEINASYLVDTVILLRHFEADGGVHRCIAVMKKRYGNHEKTIREFQITQGGIRLGKPLTQFTGLLTGLPQLAVSQESHLMNPSESNGE